MNPKSVEDFLESSAGAHFSGLLLDESGLGKSELDQPTTSNAESFHWQPFIIGEIYLPETFIISLVFFVVYIVGFCFLLILSLYKQLICVKNSKFFLLFATDIHFVMLN